MTYRFPALLALVGMAVILATASPAEAAFPGSNGQLAFDSSGNIYTVNPDGTSLMQLTSDGQSVAPAWSPNGGRIAFSRRGFIFVMTQQGRWPRKVTRLGHSSQPAWSPNGKQIAFAHGGEIWVAPSAGGSATQLTHDVKQCVADDKPTWSPLGGTIAFDQTTGQREGKGCSVNLQNRGQIVVLRLKSRVRSVITEAWGPDFTADGRGLVFASDDDVDDPPGSHFATNEFESSDLGGGHRAFYSRASCNSGGPCLWSDVAAAPTGTLVNPQGVYTETFPPKDDGSFGGFCVVSADGVDVSSDPVDAGFCNFDGTFPLPGDMDWQPLR